MWEVTKHSAEEFVFSKLRWSFRSCNLRPTSDTKMNKNSLASLPGIMNQDLRYYCFQVNCLFSPSSYMQYLRDPIKESLLIRHQHAVGLWTDNSLKVRGQKSSTLWPPIESMITNVTFQKRLRENLFKWGTARSRKTPVIYIFLLSDQLLWRQRLWTTQTIITTNWVWKKQACRQICEALEISGK